jgi:hypothetical protein
MRHRHGRALGRRYGHAKGHVPIEVGRVPIEVLERRLHKLRNIILKRGGRA